MPVLKQGSSGWDVTNLQQKLKDLGFDPNGVYGRFGPGTRDAVISFQQSKGVRHYYEFEIGPLPGTVRS